VFCTLLVCESRKEQEPLDVFAFNHYLARYFLFFCCVQSDVSDYLDRSQVWGYVEIPGEVVLGCPLSVTSQDLGTFASFPRECLSITEALSLIPAPPVKVQLQFSHLQTCRVPGLPWTG
jgi:hypothetical protein